MRNALADETGVRYVEIAAARRRKGIVTIGKAWWIGLMLIAAGSLLGLAGISFGHVLARLQAHDAHLAGLRRERDRLAVRSQAAARSAAAIDATWMHHDLIVARLAAAIDADPTANERGFAERTNAVALLVAATPAAALDRIAGPATSDAQFARARAEFLRVDTAFRAELDSIVRVGVQRRAVIVPQDLRAVAASLDQRWASISIAANGVSDDAKRSADDAARQLGAEQAKNLAQAVVDP